MKRFLECLEGTGDNKRIVKVKELSKEEVAKKPLLSIKKHYEHKCYHDEGKGRPCRRRNL